MGGRVRDFFEWRLALGFTETGHRIAQAAHDTLLPKNNHGIEEGRRHSLADNRHTRRIDQQPRFDAACLSHRARCAIASVVIPFGKSFERTGKLREELWNFRIFPEFFFRRLVMRELVAEKRPRPRRKIRKQTNSWPQQIY